VLILPKKTFGIKYQEKNYISGLEQYNAQIPVWREIGVCMSKDTIVAIIKGGANIDPAFLRQRF